MDDDRNDALLMNELALGRDGALDELMRHWERPLRCFLERMCPRAALVDEIWQDVWTRIYLYRKKYDTRRPFRPFLYTVALNACRSASSRQGRTALSRLPRAWLSRAGEDALAGVASAAAGPEEDLLAAEARRDLQAAIGRLPEMQRAVVLLYLHCNSDYAQVAEVLGRTQSTIRSQMCHALKALRGHMERPSSASCRTGVPPVRERQATSEEEP